MSKEDGRCSTCRGSRMCTKCEPTYGGLPFYNLSCECKATHHCTDCAGIGTYFAYSAMLSWRQLHPLPTYRKPSGD